MATPETTIASGMEATVIDLRTSSVRELNQTLHSSQGGHLLVTNPDGRH